MAGNTEEDIAEVIIEAILFPTFQFTKFLLKYQAQQDIQYIRRKFVFNIIIFIIAISILWC